MVRPLAFGQISSFSTRSPVGEATISSIQINDRIVTRFLGSGVLNHQLSVDTFGGAGGVINWNSSNSGISTVDQNGFAKYVSDGEATISASNGNRSVSKDLIFSTYSLQAVDILNDYEANSLSKVSSQEIDLRISGKSPALSSPIFSTQSHNTSQYQRNIDCWLSGVNLTSISPWNSVDSNRRAGVLISPQHVLFAAHYPAIKGMSIRFVDNNNILTEKILSDVVTHPDYAPCYPDIQIGLLDSPVGTGISFCKIFPSDWQSYLPSLSYSGTIPVLSTDKDENALIADLGMLDDSGYSRLTPPNLINKEKRLQFYEEKIAGDSGNPIFILISGEAVLISATTYGGAGAGTFISNHIPAINTMMSGLGGGYSLTEFNLSGLNTY
jgi:hypothetical protein